MERIRSFSSRRDREVRIGLGNRQRCILNNQPKSILPLMVTLSGFPLTRWPICSNVTAALSENTFETFSKKVNSKRNQCGQNLPTLPLMEKHTTWIPKNKNIPGWLVTTLRGQILYTGIFHLVPSISIHYNRAGVILKHGKSSRTYETSAALHRPKLHLKS